MSSWEKAIQQELVPAWDRESVPKRVAEKVQLAGAGRSQGAARGRGKALNAEDACRGTAARQEHQVDGGMPDLGLHPLDPHEMGDQRQQVEGDGQHQSLAGGKFRHHAMVAGFVRVVVEALVGFRIDRKVSQQRNQQNRRRARHPEGKRAGAVFAMKS